ncbi:branched-chain amino acid ABC transporter permease [Ornithinimicrobium sediminis]|jgi:branched-chain amino acid transport system permease protein|uniref:branched-chain amino acid ABC transporter permease n=1 Tax=Ornithinimicrobium sediminis TaxID=2904603 RepID=UPI001E62388D|nr:branched-chain amino acid ABC transporter permease [Ornithinimicrobium sediminis]MCE0486032.1 branched-chain amino acid ABC transporter permease [Ornithinimicrobium sediminis]
MAATATGIHHRSYSSELSLRATKAEYFRLGLMVVVLLVVPFVLDNYWLSIANTILIAVIGAVGLNILVGYTGQISLGQGGFLAVGAYTSVIISDRMGLPVPVAIALAVLMTAAVGTFFGLPGLRLKGLYLAIATLASQQIIEFVIRRWGWLTEDQGFIDVERLEVAGFRVERTLFEQQWYWILLAFAVLTVLTARNLFRTGLGRSFMAVRDQDIAAEAIGVNLARAKLTAFAVSSGFVGLAGALTAHYTEIVTWERFTLDVSILYLAMIIVGGLGSIAGAVYGAIFMTLLPVLIREAATSIRDVAPFLASQLPAVQNAVFGLTIIVFLIVEPRGLDRIWQRIKDYVRFWPFRY